MRDHFLPAFIAVFAFTFIFGVTSVFSIIPDDTLRRGDANNDTHFNAPDASYIANYLFQGGPEPACFDAADANDDGVINSVDPTFIMQFLFDDGPPPPSPGPYNCGVDPTEDFLDCEASACDE